MFLVLGMGTERLGFGCLLLGFWKICLFCCVYPVTITSLLFDLE